MSDKELDPIAITDRAFTQFGSQTGRGTCRGEIRRLMEL